MKIPPKLERTAMILKLFKKDGRAIDPRHSEELQNVSTTFELQGTATPVWNNAEVYWSLPSSKDNEVIFSSFIDGVQRTSVVYWVSVHEIGALVPIVLSHIAAGITFRENNRKLRAYNELINDKTLLLFPLKGLEEKGFEGGPIRDKIKEGEIIDEKDIPKDATKLFDDENGSSIVLCDTTFNSIDRSDSDENKALNEAYSSEGSNYNNLLVESNLLNSYKVRQRALGRVNTLRQILEMMVLVKYRENFPAEDSYILVDGPLFFLGKWIKKYGRFKDSSDDINEATVLKNAVGMVKTLKSRPKNPDDLKSILNLKENNYSRLMKIEDAVDVAGEDHYSNNFHHPHITTFMRFRSPPDIELPSPLGLIRVDLHVSTFGYNNYQEVEDDELESQRMVDRIVLGVNREKWPGITQKGRAYNEVFPIEETERMLRSRLYSFVEMNYIYSFSK